jgi:cytochrome d ubiquinol oxidase subunit I
MDALTLHRIHFAFTITYHYLFPQLTMGLALLIVALKTVALRTNDERYDNAARWSFSSARTGRSFRGALAV